MSDFLLGLMASYGLAAVFLATLLSCLAVPVPTALVMLGAGALAASGDFVLWQVALAALAGALVGDQAGFAIGRAGGDRLARVAHRPAAGAALARARGLLDRWGDVGVFLSRWLLSPLGPYVNLVAGAGGFGWGRFTLWDIAGEAVWVTIYVGLGFAFASRITEIAGLLGNAVGFLVAGLITVVLGRALFAARRTARAGRAGR